MSAQFVNDGDILWLTLPKVGSPPVWNHDTEYNLGDVVVPRFPSAGQESLMFQCVGFVGTSGGSTPSFPTTVGQELVEGTNKWIARDPNSNPAQIDNHEYYYIKKTVTAGTT